MIPPLDPAPRPDEPLRLASAQDPVGDAPPRFAALLKDTSLACARQTSYQLPSLDPEGRATRNARARVFNQDGLFGVAQPESACSPMTAIVVAEHYISPTESCFAAMAPEPTSRIALGGTTSASGSSAHATLPFPTASTSRPAATPGVRSSAVTATPLPSFKSEMRPDAPIPSNLSGQSAPDARRSTPRPNAIVAVALHAAARGMEVAVQIQSLGERERAALADEIAALLSAYGYAPAQISVITSAARAAHQEHR